MSRRWTFLCSSCWVKVVSSWSISVPSLSMAVWAGPLLTSHNVHPCSQNPPRWYKAQYFMFQGLRATRLSAFLPHCHLKSCVLLPVTATGRDACRATPALNIRPGGLIIGSLEQSQDCTVTLGGSDPSVFYQKQPMVFLCWCEMSVVGSLVRDACRLARRSRQGCNHVGPEDSLGSKTKVNVTSTSSPV